MDWKKRLLRRPVTTVFWLLLVTAMSLLLIVGFALYRSSGNLSRVLDSHHTTVAVRTDQATTGTAIEGGVKWETIPHGLSQEEVDFLEGLPGVENVFFHTLTGGYSPAFTPIIGVKDTMIGRTDACYMVNESYDDVLAVVEITAIYEKTLTGSYDMTALGLTAEEPEYYLCAEARVVELLEGSADYQNPQDEFINLEVTTIGQTATDYLRVGSRYLVQGRYSPEDMGANPKYLHPSIQSERPVMVQGDQLWYIGAMEITPEDWYTVIGMDTEDTAPYLARLEGSAADFLEAPENRVWAEIAESYDTALHSLPVMGTDCLESMYLFVNNEAVVTQGRSFTAEEYEAGAGVCLLSESMAEKSGLQVGDTFTMSQFLVHDFGEYNDDADNFSTALHPDGMLNNPTVGYVGQDTTFLTENQEFTVIGLYRLQNEWTDTSYSLTPNTVFIPKKAQIEGGFGGPEEMVTVTMEDGTSSISPKGNGAHGVYLSVKLHNGKMSRFLQALEGTELAGNFITLDQGYGAIQESVNAVAQSAWEVFRVALLGWLLILALYVVLYQGLQRKNLGVMRSLGAGKTPARRYLFGSGLLLAGLGVVIGAVAGAIVLDTIQNRVLLAPVAEAMMSQHSGGQALTQEALSGMLQSSGLSPSQLIFLALAQLGIIGAALWVHAALLAGKNPRKLLRM